MDDCSHQIGVGVLRNGIKEASGDDPAPFRQSVTSKNILRAADDVRLIEQCAAQMGIGGENA